MSGARARAALGLATVLVVSGGACVNDDIPDRPLVGGGDNGSVELAVGPGCGDGEMRLLILGRMLYWTEEKTGRVRSVPTIGGPTRDIATGQVSPGAIAGDGNWLFWVNGETVVRRSFENGSTKVFVEATTLPVIAGDENKINALLVDRDTLFFGRYRYAFSIPTAGGDRRELMFSPETDAGRPGAFTVDAQHLYQTEIGHGAISRELLNGMQDGLLEGGGDVHQKFAPDRIAVSQDALVTDVIALGGGDVIWASENMLFRKPTDSLEHAAMFTIGLSRTLSPITGFVLKGDVLYFGVASDNEIEKMPLAGGEASVVVANQRLPRQFVTDGSAIYWRTADCRLMKLGL